MINLNEGPDHRVMPHVLTHTTLIVWPGKRKSTCWDILSGKILATSFTNGWIFMNDTRPDGRFCVLKILPSCRMSQVFSCHRFSTFAKSAMRRTPDWWTSMTMKTPWGIRRPVGHCGVQNNQNTKLGGSAVRSGDVNNSWRRRGPYRFGAQVLTWGRRARRGRRASQTEMWNQTVRRGFATVLAVWIFVWLNHVVSCCFYIQFLICNVVMDTLISHVARASW
jgi:hypothetical protein